MLAQPINNQSLDYIKVKKAINDLGAAKRPSHAAVLRVINACGMTGHDSGGSHWQYNYKTPDGNLLDTHLTIVSKVPCDKAIKDLLSAVKIILDYIPPQSS